MKRVSRRIELLAAAAFLLGSAPGAAAQPSRAGEPGTEQEIGAVRTAYQEVVQAAAAHHLRRLTKQVSCGGPNDFPEAVTTMRDSAGRIRQLTIEAGTDDHVETHRFYYDSAGRLRFIFVTRGAVNGTAEEERVYYAADRRLLRRRMTRLQGPGYFFEPAKPIWNPAEWLRRPCSQRQ